MQLTHKARLVALVLIRYVRARRDLERYALPELVDRYSTTQATRAGYRIRTLRSAVDRLLILPWRRLRCLPRALVLYLLLVENGHDPKLVIGLPEGPDSPEAHAWVEIDGIDVGPAPGREGRQSLVRYPINDRFSPQSPSGE